MSTELVVEIDARSNLCSPSSEKGRVDQEELTLPTAGADLGLGTLRFLRSSSWISQFIKHRANKKPGPRNTDQEEPNPKYHESSS